MRMCNLHDVLMDVEIRRHYELYNITDKNWELIPRFGESRIGWLVVLGYVVPREVFCASL